MPNMSQHERVCVCVCLCACVWGDVSAVLPLYTQVYLCESCMHISVQLGPLSEQRMSPSEGTHLPVTLTSAVSLTQSRKHSKRDLTRQAMSGFKSTATLCSPVTDRRMLVDIKDTNVKALGSLQMWLYGEINQRL